MKINPIGHLVKTNPKRTQFRNRRQNSEDRKQMIAKSGFTKDYEEKMRIGAMKFKANSNPISERSKMDVNIYLTKEYENKRCRGLRKNKANFRQEMPKMPYLPACVKRHYAGTVKAMQPGTCFSGLIDDVRIYNRACFVMPGMNEGYDIRRALRPGPSWVWSWQIYFLLVVVFV